ncbi:MAG: hypothetical protein AB7K09_25530 [Planctomycetota bacterium]
MGDPIRPQKYGPPVMPPDAPPMGIEPVKGPARTDISKAEKRARRRMMGRRFAGALSPMQQGLVMWLVMIVLGVALALAAGGKPRYAEQFLHITSGELALYGAAGGFVVGFPVFWAISRRKKVRTPRTDAENAENA